MAIIYNIDAAIRNSAFNILQEPIQMILDNETEAFEKESIIPKVFVMKTSDKYREEYRSTTAMDGFKPTEDMEPAGLSDFEEGYNKQFVFQTWTNAFIVSKQTIEDNNLMSIEPKAFGFIKSYGRTRELYAVNVIGAGLGGDLSDKQKSFKITANTGKGMDTTDGTIDGAKQVYFHNAHKPVGYVSGGERGFTQSNKFYSTLAFDGTDAGLSEKIVSILGQVVNVMNTYKDDKGNIVPVNPTRIVIGADYVLEAALKEGLKMKYGDTLGSFEIVKCPYLNDIVGFRSGAETPEHAMLLIDPIRNREGLGLAWFDRVPLEINSYIDSRTKANIWDGRARFGAGFGDFRAMAYVSLTSAVSTNATLISPVISAKPVAVVNPETDPVNTKEVAEEVIE